MRDGWEETTLGTIASINPEATNGWRSDKRVMYIDLSTVSAERGIRLGPSNEMVFGEAPGRARRVVRTSDVLVATVRPYLRGFAQVPSELDGQVASTGFAVLRAKPGIDPGFVWALVRTDEFVDFLMERATGSNYPAVRPSDVAAFPVSLPPLEEQRRITDLISSIDHSIHSLNDLEERNNTTALSITSSLFSGVDSGDTPIRDLLETSIGGVWGGEPGTSEVDVRVYRSTEFNPDGALTIEGGVTRSITKRQLLSRRLQAGDILLEKSGGGPNQPVGRVALVPEHAEVAVCANFVQLLRPDKSKVDPIYLWSLLWWWHATGRTQVFQRRTTGIRNLQTTAYLEQEVTLPPLEEQQKVASLLRKVDADRRSTLELRSRVADLRSSLIANLLSGAHEIPDSYDRFLEEAS